MIFCAFFTNYWPKIRGKKQLFHFINILCFKMFHVGASLGFLDEHMRSTFDSEKSNGSKNFILKCFQNELILQELCSLMYSFSLLYLQHCYIDDPPKLGKNLRN